MELYPIHEGTEIGTFFSSSTPMTDFVVVWLEPLELGGPSQWLEPLKLGGSSQCQQQDMRRTAGPTKQDELSGQPRV